MDTNPRCRVPLASLMMIGVALVVMSPLQSADARSNPWYAPYSRYTPYDQRTPYTPTRSTTTCGDAIVQKPNSSGIQEVCDSGTNNGKAGYCDKTCSCMVKAWYGDNDGDGFGSPYTIASCTKPAGKFTDKPGDWNDSLATMYPGAPELCDGLDNNQNNAADEGIQIDDSNLCTDDFCMGGKVYHSNTKKSCNDNNACTNNDVCALGKCGGTPVATTATYSEWGVCQANSIQTRTVTFNPPGCGSTAGMQLAQKCALPQPSPPQPPALFWPGQKKLAVGSGHICAFSKNGKLQCWGNNQYGQLGNGKLGAAVNPYAQDVQFSPGDVPMSVAAGGYSACSPLSTGAVKCWGNYVATPTAVASITNAKAVVVGYSHACALLTTGTVKCWGDNKFGQLGDGTFTLSSNASVDVKGLSNVVEVAVGQNYTCALIKGGSVKCWGNNEFGQLGNNTKVNSVIPVPVLLTKPASSIIAGGEHTCALMNDLTVQCWGWNGLYQQGPKKYSGNNLSPVTIEGLNIMSVSELALGYGYTCVLGSAGSWVNTNVLCVGDNKYGQIGAVSATVDKPTKVPVPNIVTSISAGGSTVCAVILNQSQGTSSLQCWGEASHGELGGDPTQQSGLKSSQFSYPGGSSTLYYAATPTLVPNVSIGTPTSPPPICGVGLIWDTGSQLCACPSGKKWDTTGKQCIAYTEKKGGDSTSISSTEQQLMAQKQTLDEGIIKLGQSAMAIAKAQEALRKEAREKLDPYLDKLLQNGAAATPAPSGISPSTKLSEISSAQMKLENDFKSVVSTLSTIVKKQNDSAQSASLSGALLQASVYYLSAIFNVSYPPVVAGSSCYIDPVEQQLVFQYGINTVLKKDAWTPLSKLIADFHCMSLDQLNTFDSAFTSAFKYTVEMIGSTHPASKKAVQDQLLQIYSPLIINLYETVRHEGAGVPVRSLVTLLGDRMKNVTDNAPLKTDAGVTLDPSIFGLYNSDTGKPEQIPTACTGTLKEYWVNNCLIFRSLVHALNDSSMDDFGSCPFWTTLRVGKPCPPQPAPLSGWLKKTSHITVSLLKNALVSTAHADTFDSKSCETKGMEADMCGKCVPKAVGSPQDETPKTQCEISCAQCTIPQGCITTLFCPFENKNKSFCQKPIYAADGKTVACPGSPCQEEPCSDMQKAYGNCPNLPICNDCSKCVHDNAVNTCKGIVQECFTLCNKNNGLNCSCGNWKIDAGEECDDGNMKNGDGCSATCKKVSACGNGIIDSGEACDDGNKNNFDKCANDCTCGQGVCGDGIVECGEKCDDGPKNGYPGSKCSATCYLLCGNGFVDDDAGEKCDTGKNDGWDGCNKDCQIQAPICGNTHIEKGETCDDGNTKSGDNCSSKCLLEKEYCNQCKYPNFKGKSDACDKYYAQMESSQKPGCTIASTPWDNSSCTLTPYKKGDPCWMQLPFSKPDCQNDPVMVKCLSDCIANEGSIPPEVKLDCDQGPLKKQKSGSGYDAATLDEMKKIYNDNWDKAIQALKLLVGNVGGDDLSDAKKFGADIIDGIRTCTSDEISAYTIQTKGGTAGALYMSDKKEVCYDQNTFKSISKVSAEKAIVHEALHAAFDRIAIDAKKKQLKSECGFPDFYATKSGGLDHWVFNILSSNELIKNPMTPNGFDSVMCPKSN